MLETKNPRTRLGACLLVLCLLAWANANEPRAALMSPASQGPGVQRQEASERVDMRLVQYTFSAEVWGGSPFSAEEKQRVMARAMLKRSLVRLEREVPQMASGADFKVRHFLAVYQVDGRTAPPSIEVGYFLELMVPRKETTFSLDLINRNTNVANRVEVAPDDADGLNASF